MDSLTARPAEDAASDRRTALVFIHNSEGELDWIAPFVGDPDGDLDFFVYVYHPRLDAAAKRRLFDQYFSGSPQVVYMNDLVTTRRSLARLDLMLDAALLRLRRFTARGSELARGLVDRLRRPLSRSFFAWYDAPSFDVVFRDYNLKDSLPLASVLARNPRSKVVIFPHSTAIISSSERLPKDAPKRVPADLFLENTHLSTRFIPVYEDVFRAVGSPQMSRNYARTRRIFDPGRGAVLVITRNCDPFFFGFTQEDANRVFAEILQGLRARGIACFVKHHPRDVHVASWRSVQSGFPEVVELDRSLNDYAEPTAYVLSFYSSAGLILTSHGVPVFDVSPYLKTNVEALPYHFLDDHGEVSHEFLEIGLMGRITAVAPFIAQADAEALRRHAASQEMALKEVFPPDTNQAIHRHVRELFDRGGHGGAD